MLLSKIWERFFFKEALKTALLFLACFYGLYVLIDYAHHTGHFKDDRGYFSWIIFAIYYGCEFVNKAELLIPLSILLGTIKVLCKLNQDNELIAMMASGIKMTTLLRPFVLIGLLGTGALYLNNQLLLPIAAKELQYIADRNHYAKQKNSVQLAAQHLILDDQSTLLFQHYDSSRNSFFDVYWILSSDEIYRIRELVFSTPTPTGYIVEAFRRDPLGKLIASNQLPMMPFPEMQFNEKKLLDTLTMPEALSLTELWSQMPKDLYAESEKQARLVSTFHQKIIFPWLCLLAVLGPAPFCMHFSRHFPVLLVYACGIFGFMAFYIAMNAAHVLGRRQFADPILAMWVPFILLSLLITWRFASKRNA
ncbi:MAG: LptF/LptG family permease [Parachlamydiaceae bacterium]|nr:LptF/LptG family permease [Parachlamydiaceae bacterium]